MKMKTISLLLGLLLSALLAVGCAGNVDSDEVIGNDWRSIRGYSSETYHLMGQEALISLLTGEDFLGYGFYNAEDGALIAGFQLDTSLWTVDDMDQDKLWTLYEKDLNQDGFNEYGVPMQDGLVLWYEYVMGTGFRLYGEGNAEGPEPPMPAAVGAGLSDPLPLAEDLSVQLRYYEDSEGACGYEVWDAEDPEIFYGMVILPESYGYSVADLDRSSEEFVILEDLDGDGVSEIGLPLVCGNIHWFRYDGEAGEFVSSGEEQCTGNSNEAATLLMDLLGDAMNGKTLIPNGTELVNGVPCELFTVGVNTPEKFTAEDHFAVDPDGNVYRADIVHGMEYVPYEP